MLYIWILSLPPANVVCEGYIFTGVCDSVNRGGRAWFYLFGGHAWFYSGGVRGFIQGVYMVLFGGGACMVFSVFSDTMRSGQWAGGTHPTGMHSCLRNRLRSLPPRFPAVHLEPTVEILLMWLVQLVGYLQLVWTFLLNLDIRIFAWLRLWDYRMFSTSQKIKGMSRPSDPIKSYYKTTEKFIFPE